MIVTTRRHHVVVMAHRRKVQTGVLFGKICLELLVQLKLARLLFNLVDVHVRVDQRHQIVRSLQQRASSSLILIKICLIELTSLETTM